ncbi:hypothetical protein GC096_34245 [Paenibacillus sp. LMG 31461]|uniref:Lipoprotein n=1 Tax=Paenibacillus plantarum TaxID=2654975 RepID=A0ABX1XML2_9BACL|nr:hypothetical protein [Paenibacillus plantarum]NOU69083.1 hypothetical protein [Paenibacillus plantarum]
MQKFQIRICLFVLTITILTGCTNPFPTPTNTPITSTTPAPDTATPTESKGTPIAADVRLLAFDTSYFDQVIAAYNNAPALVDTQPNVVMIEGNYQKLTFVYKLTSPLLDVPQMLSDAGYGPITDSALINKIFGKTENDVYGRSSDNTLMTWSVVHGIDDDLTVVYANSSDGNLPDIKAEPKVKYVFDPSLINKVVNVYKDIAPDFSIAIGTPPKKIVITFMDELMFRFYVNINSRDAHIKSLQTTLESAGFSPTGESFFQGYVYKKGKITARYDYGDPVDGVSEIGVILDDVPLG